MGLRNSVEPLTKVTLNLFKRDVERLKILYPDKHTTYVRHLVRAHLTRSDASIASAGADLAEEIDLSEIAPDGIDDEIDIDLS